jgi:hypothetical protein
MPTSVRLDEETEALLVKTARALNKTKTDILKISIKDFCNKALREKRKRPYDLISDLIGVESSGTGNLGIDGEKILRKVFRTKR